MCPADPPARGAFEFGVLEHAPLLAYAFRVEGDEFILTSVNAEGRRRNPALVELCGKPMAALYRDQPEVVRAGRRCATDQTLVELELPVRRYDRTEATQYLRLSFVPSPPGHILLFMRDVANPEVSQVALAESEARYKSLLASLPDAVLVRGADGRALFCNEVAVDLFGAQSAAELIGETQVLAPGIEARTQTGERLEPTQDPSLEVLATGEPVLGRILALVGHGKWRWLRVASQPIRTEAGVVTGSVTTYTEITAAVNADEALRTSAARLDLALAAARMGVWEFEPATDVGVWSPNLDAIFHLGGRGRGFAGFMACIHPEDREAFQASAARLIRGAAGDTFEDDYRIVGEDHVTRWARIRGRITFEGDRRRLSGTVMDITEQHHLEEELRRTSRLESLGRLAGGVAHDFNNLLTAILGSLELLEDACHPAGHEDLATARHSALRARDLTRQLLAFARRQPVAWKTLDLAALVRNVEHMLKRLVGPTIEITLTSSGLVPVQGDPALLEQVLVNLVVNGRDAMPHGGTLAIRVTRHAPVAADSQGTRALLEVRDSGLGMDGETRRQVFDPFFTTKSHGTGLGLASSYGIVQQHQGDITVESEPGQGTTFRVFLPCLESLPPPPEDPTPHSTAPSTPRLVLIVDDEAIVRETASRVLQSLGYRVLTAGDGEEALSLVQEHRKAIELLLCDVVMPHVDGPTVAARIREACPAIRVLFMSGYSEDMPALALQGAAFLQKPFRRAELAAKLGEVLGQASPG